MYTPPHNYMNTPKFPLFTVFSRQMPIFNLNVFWKSAKIVLEKRKFENRLKLKFFENFLIFRPPHNYMNTLGFRIFKGRKNLEKFQ